MSRREVSLFKESYKGFEPVIKAISIGKVAAFAAVILLFQMYFWLYEAGFLSEFGITKNLLSRSMLEAEGIWIYFGIDLYLLFSKKIMWVAYVCIATIIVSVLRTVAIFKGKLDAAAGVVRVSFFERFRLSRSMARKIIIFCDLFVLKNRRWLAFALANYVLVLFSLVILLLVIYGKTFFDLGLERTSKMLVKFRDDKRCEDAYGYTGCYKITDGAKEYRGLLVARNDKQYFLYTGEKLLVVNNNKMTLLSRDMKVKSVLRE